MCFSTGKAIERSLVPHPSKTWQLILHLYWPFIFSLLSSWSVVNACLPSDSFSGILCWQHIPTSPHFTAVDKQMPLGTPAHQALWGYTAHLHPEAPWLEVGLTSTHVAGWTLLGLSPEENSFAGLQSCGDNEDLALPLTFPGPTHIVLWLSKNLCSIPPPPPIPPCLLRSQFLFATKDFIIDMILQTY